MTEALERGAGVALWRQIAQTLRSDIQVGRFAGGKQLPTEAALSQRFAVNRHTVRRALAYLADQGLVRVEQGRGSFVSETPVDYRVSRRTRFTDLVAEQRRAPGGRLLRAENIAASSQIAKALGIKPGTKVTVLERISEVDGVPVGIASHYFPKRRFPTLASVYKEEQSITKTLARLGVADYTRRETRVTAAMPSADDARHLGQPASRPILQTESINVDPEGKPIEFGRTRFASERVRLLFESDPS